MSMFRIVTDETIMRVIDSLIICLRGNTFLYCNIFCKKKISKDIKRYTVRKRYQERNFLRTAFIFSFHQSQYLSKLNDIFQFIISITRFSCLRVVIQEQRHQSNKYKQGPELAVKGRWDGNIYKHRHALRIRS